jgi:hypothetical protein
MSVVPPIATASVLATNGRDVPIASLTQCSRQSLFDHLVGAGEQRWRHREAERLRSLEIDHQFVLGRVLHRQVARFLALEDAIDVAGRLPEIVDEIRPPKSAGYSDAKCHGVALPPMLA